MIREFKKLRKELNEENLEVYEKIEIKLSIENIDSRVYKEIMEDLLGSILESQKRNESLEQVLGKDLDKFCNEIIENSKRKGKGFMLIEEVHKIIMILSVAYIIKYTFSLITGGNFFGKIIDKTNMEISILGFLIICFITIGSSLISRFINKSVFKSEYRRFLINLIFIIFIFGTGSLLDFVNLEKNYFEVNIIYVVIIFIFNHLLFKAYKKKKY